MINLTRTNIILKPDPSRVLLRLFVPGDAGRIAAIASRVIGNGDAAAGVLLDQVLGEFSWRHGDIRELFQKRFDSIRECVPGGADLSETMRQLIGAHFLGEYSVESAALFNPSIVPDPDQSGLPEGALRFILSLRATGEGHISSITFRRGVIHSDHRIEVVTPTGLLTEPRQTPNSHYEKPLLLRSLQEMGLAGEFTERVFDRLGERFPIEELRRAIDAQLPAEPATAERIWILARSNFEVEFAPEQQLSERILFPATATQRNGIEDARFVHFHDDNGDSRYYATFTAYDGQAVVPELVETPDFLRFRFYTLNGPAARNKGMALFPRRIGGRYAMLSRQDNENISIMFSGNVHFWNESQVLLKPKFPWEAVQLGNCGSPIETDAGWLVLTHGVGSMRKYSIGAFLLDRDDPRRVIGRLREPLLQPNQNEREGYVPNVLYTCGLLLHRGELYIPYGVSDHSTGFATVPLSDVLEAMEPDE